MDIIYSDLGFFLNLHMCLNTDIARQTAKINLYYYSFSIL